MPFQLEFINAFGLDRSIEIKTEDQFIPSLGFLMISPLLHSIRRRVKLQNGPSGPTSVAFSFKLLPFLSETEIIDLAMSLLQMLLEV